MKALNTVGPEISEGHSLKENPHLVLIVILWKELSKESHTVSIWFFIKMTFPLLSYENLIWKNSYDNLIWKNIKFLTVLKILKIYSSSLCHGLTPACSSASHSHLVIPPTAWLGIRMVKIRKRMGWDKDSFIRKEKSTHASKANNSFATSHGQPSIQQSSRKQGSIIM